MLFMQAKRGLTGIMNYTNPGCISHNEIMELYKQYIDPEFTWQNFNIEEQAKVIKAPRSNNLLDTKRVCLSCFQRDSHPLPDTDLPLRPQSSLRHDPHVLNVEAMDDVK